MTEKRIMGGQENAFAMDEAQVSRFVMAEEQRVQLNDLADALNEAVQKKRQVIGKVETMQRARNAAQADADAARQKWREKLRESDGALTREVQKLRVAERAALSLVEEYTALEEEIAKDLPHTEIHAAEVAEACIKMKDLAVRQAADQAYDQAILQSGSSLALAFELFRQAENSQVVKNSRLDTTDLATEFFCRLGKHVREAFHDSVGSQVSAFTGLPRFDLQEVNMQLVDSPAARSKLRAKTVIEAG